MRLCHLSIFVLMLVVSPWLVACGSKQESPAGPATVPVRGKLRFTKGGDAKSLFDKQARIELESIEQPSLHAVGAIEEDGSFTVATLTPDGGSPGAVPGSHRVRIELEENAQRLVAPKFLDFQKSGITVKVPSESDLIVEVWR